MLFTVQDASLADAAAIAALHVQVWRETYAHLLDSTLNGAPAMLWVAKENPRAIAFYRRNGFEFDGREQADPALPMMTSARMFR